jgi:transcriptional regulator with XRE-family HTH domain
LDWTLTNIGPRLRELRKQRGLTLAQLAAASECSEGFLSGVENGTNVPSISLLAVLAAVVGADLSSFFPTEMPSKVSVYRAATPETLTISEGATEQYVLLSSRLDDPSYTALLHRVSPTSDAATYLHYGERFGVVLAGEVELTFGASTRTLVPGDTMHYSPRTDHRLSVRSADGAEILWLVAPALI